METLIQDLRHSLRGLLRNPGFTLVVVATLALGIGGNATVFTALRSALLVGPPYPDADRIMALDIVVTDREGLVSNYPWSFPKYETMRAAVTSFEAVGVRRGATVSLAGGAQPVRAYAEGVTADYYTLFGALPLIGRLTNAAEDAPGAEPRSAVLSHAVWQQQFGSDSSILGRSILVNGVSLEVVGVMRPEFRGISDRVELWLPVRALPALGNAQVLTRRWAHGFQAFGRRRPGVPAEQAIAEMAAVGTVVAAAHPAPEADGSSWSGTAISISAARTNEEGRTLLAVLGGAVALVLLLACVNIANMLLARAASRERELVIRAALGAGRRRLLRQLVTEALLLAAAGGAAGLVLAFWGADLLRTLLPRMTGPNGVLFLSPDQITIDGGIVAFAAAVSLMSGIAMSVVPAWRFSAPEGSRALREGAASSRGLGSLRRPSLRGALVAAEVALAVVLLAGAGLMIRTMSRIASIDPGFETNGLLTFGYTLPFSDPRSQSADFHASVVERLAAIPGVQGAALSSCAALSGCYDINSVKRVDGQAAFESGERPSVRVHYVSDDYFRTLGVPVLGGRAFNSGDHAGSAPVFVVSAATARRFFGDSSATGRSMSVSIGLTPGETMAQIVGVVGDVKHVQLREEPVADLYVSMRQEPYGEPTVYLRSAGNPMALLPAVRLALREIAPEMPLSDVHAEGDLVAANTLGERVVAGSLAAFAVLALVLASLGVYGVVSHSVGQRRREVAVRMALGAEPRAVLRLILSEGLSLVLVGAVVGVAGALALGGTLASLLYGVTPRDPLTLSAMVVLLVSVATVAVWMPARRAARTDPMTALRND